MKRKPKMERGCHDSIASKRVALSTRLWRMGWKEQKRRKKKEEKDSLLISSEDRKRKWNENGSGSSNGRGTNVVVKQQQTHKKKIEKMKKKENSTPIPIKIGFFSCSISIHWKCVHIWVYRSITTPKKKKSLSLCLQSRYCALVLSQQSHSRGKVFLFFDLPASQKNNK